MGRDDTWQEYEDIGDNRPPIYDDDGIRVFRASGLGNCDRSLVAWGMGIEGDQQAPPTIRRAWAEGHRNEPIILNLLRTRELGTKDREGRTITESWKILDSYDIDIALQGKVYWSEEKDGVQQPRLRLPFHGLSTPSEIRMALDGVVEVHSTGEGSEWDLGEVAVAEAKAFSEGTYAKYRRHGLAAFPYYETQVAIQMHATGEPVLFVIGIKDDQGVVQDIVTDVYVDLPMSLGKLKARVAKINRLIDAGSVDFPCPMPLMYPCPHLFLHDEDERVVEVRKSVEDIPDVGVLQMILKSYGDAKAFLKTPEVVDAQKVIKDGDKIIKDWINDHPEMADVGLDVPVGDGQTYKLKVKVTSESVRVPEGKELETRLAAAKVVKSPKKVSITVEEKKPTDPDTAFEGL
jgi:hypothetical protein